MVKYIWNGSQGVIMPYHFNPKLKVQYMIKYMQYGVLTIKYFPTSVMAMAYRQKLLSYRGISADSVSYPLRISN